MDIQGQSIKINYTPTFAKIKVKVLEVLEDEDEN